MYRGSDSKGLCSVSTKYTSVVSFICRLEPQTPRPGPHRHLPRKNTTSAPTHRQETCTGCAETAAVGEPGGARAPAARAGSGPAHGRLCSSSRCRRVCSKRRGCVGLPVPRTGNALVKSDEPGEERELSLSDGSPGVQESWQGARPSLLPWTDHRTWGWSQPLSPSDAGSVSRVGHWTLRGDSICHSLGEASRDLDVRGAQQAAEPTHSRSPWGGVSAALPGVLALRGSRDAVPGTGRE